MKEDEDEEMGIEEEKEDRGAQNMDLDEEQEQEKKHICHVCGRGFKSGKGLGGHKRIHKSNDSDDEFINSDYDSNDPDFEYKVDVNDMNSKRRVTRSVFVNDFISKGWPTKRRSLKVHKSDLKNPPDMMDVESNNLLILAAAASAEAEKSSNLDVAEKKSLSKIKKESSSCTYDHNKLEEGRDGARDKHVCVTCKKSFNSYQSLGGHVRSHHRDKKLKIVHDQVKAKFEPEEKILGLACDQRSTIAQTAAQTAARTGQVTEKVEEVKIIRQERMVLDFDLNEPAPEALEEEERENKLL